MQHALVRLRPHRALLVRLVVVRAPRRPERHAHDEHVGHRGGQPANARVRTRETRVEVVFRVDRRRAACLAVQVERVLWCVDVDVDETNEAVTRLHRQQVLRPGPDALLHLVAQVLLEERCKLAVFPPHLPAHVRSEQRHAVRQVHLQRTAETRDRYVLHTHLRMTLKTLDDAFNADVKHLMVPTVYRTYAGRHAHTIYRVYTQTFYFLQVSCVSTYWCILQRSHDL